MQMEMDSWEYCELLKSQIQTSNVPIEKLCEGLCSPSMLSRICNGERTANKMMRDRLMHRLGLADERNENFLFREEYEKWKVRQRIVIRINEEDYAATEALLDEYEEDVCNNVERQFCLVMRIQILRMQGADDEELGALYESALKLTVPHIDKKNVNELQLSAQELDLALEYAYYCHPQKLEARCEELLQYIEKSNMDEHCLAKIMPKIVYYQCRKMQEEQKVDYGLLLRKCNVAIECLRDAKRLFFLWELLKERELLYGKLIDKLAEENEPERIQVISGLREENEQWMEAVQAIYLGCDIKAETKNCCYLYLEKNTNCINDVVKKRRLMLGMTKKQLCEGICSEKTIGRLENTNGKTQLLIIKELFERLKMSGEYQRKDIVTGNPEAYQILERIVRHGNDRAYDLALMELGKLEEMIPMDVPLNQQYIRRQRAVTGYQKGLYTKEEALEELKKALNLTVSYEVITRCENRYLTCGEMTCIQNMAFVRGKNAINEYYLLAAKICGEYEQEDMIPQNIGMYEFVMSAFASMLGNIGEYEKSDMISNRVLRECVWCRRFGTIASNIYSIAWNSKEKKDATFSRERWEYGVKMSAKLFHIQKSYNSERFILSNL